MPIFEEDLRGIDKKKIDCLSVKSFTTWNVYLQMGSWVWYWAGRILGNRDIFVHEQKIEVITKFPISIQGVFFTKTALLNFRRCVRISPYTPLFYIWLDWSVKYTPSRWQNRSEYQSTSTVSVKTNRGGGRFELVS